MPVRWQSELERFKRRFMISLKRRASLVKNTEFDAVANVNQGWRGLSCLPSIWILADLTVESVLN
jgi:hypothetical protein